MAYEAPKFTPGTVVDFYTLKGYHHKHIATTPRDYSREDLIFNDQNILCFPDGEIVKPKKITGKIESMYWDDVEETWRYKVAVFSKLHSTETIIEVPEQIITSEKDYGDENENSVALEKYLNYTSELEEKEIEQIKERYLESVKVLKIKYFEMLNSYKKEDN